MSRILIVDDKEDVRVELTDRIASMGGHETEGAATQEEALEKLARIEFDCVLLDLAIPFKFDGVARVENGKNTLKQILEMPDPPAVVIIPGTEFEGHALPVEVLELGASAFVTKPFDLNPVEPKIEMVLARRAARRAVETRNKETFQGGTLIRREDGIELCGVVVGGTRSDANIGRIIDVLAVKGPEHYRRFSATKVAAALGGISASTVANAIKAFRNKCEELLGAGQHDVIASEEGGGYQLRDWIQVVTECDPSPTGEAEADKATVVRHIKRHGSRTWRQLRSGIAIPDPRIKAALKALEEENTLALRGSGSNITYSLKEGI